MTEWVHAKIYERMKLENVQLREEIATCNRMLAESSETVAELATERDQLRARLLRCDLVEREIPKEKAQGKR